MADQKRVAVLVERDYEDLELWYPYLRLVEAGCNVSIVGPEADKEYLSKHGYPIKSCTCMVDANKQQWGAVVVPGGWARIAPPLSRDGRTGPESQPAGEALLLQFATAHHYLSPPI